MRNTDLLDKGVLPKTVRKAHSFNGIAGCVSQRKAKSCGSLIGVYDSIAQGIDVDYPWACICETHGNCCCFDTRKLAEYHSRAPEGWCEECQAAAKAAGESK